MIVKEEAPYLLLMAVSVYAFAVLLFGCACWTPSNPDYNAPKCVVARQSVDCTTDAVVGQAGQLLPVVQWIVKGADRATWDLDWITDTLMAMGFADVGCILAALENDFLKSPQNESPSHKVFAAWKAKHPGVKYKLKSGAVVQ